jgi:hypothetical protein
MNGDSGNKYGVPGIDAAIKRRMGSAKIKAFCRNIGRHPLPNFLAATAISFNTIIVSKDYPPFPLSGEIGTIHEYCRMSILGKERRK